MLLTERLDADAQRKFGILPPEPFYYGPDVPVPEQALPEGALDVLRVANGGGAAASRALQAEWWHRSASLAPTSESREARVLKAHSLPLVAPLLSPSRPTSVASTLAAAIGTAVSASAAPSLLHLLTHPLLWPRCTPTASPRAHSVTIGGMRAPGASTPTSPTSSSC